MKIYLSIIFMFGALVTSVLSTWGVQGGIILSITILIAIVVIRQFLKWWEQRQFLKWCGGLLWNHTEISQHPNDREVLQRAKHVADGLIESGNQLGVLVHAVILNDSSIVTLYQKNGKVETEIKKVNATLKMYPDMPHPAVENFEQYLERVSLFKRLDRVKRDDVLSSLVKDGTLSRRIYEREVLNQNV